MLLKIKKITNSILTLKSVYGSVSESKRSRFLTGFTLIELLLYIAIVSVIIFTIFIFLLMTLQSRIKNQVIAEVEQQGAQVMQLTTQTIRNATLINSPIPGNTSSTLSLNVLDVGKNPTIFDISGETIRIKEGAGTNVPLTSSRVTASGLNFQNLSRTGTPGVIRVQFTLTHINPANKNEYNYSQTFYESASIR